MNLGTAKRKRSAKGVAVVARTVAPADALPVAAVATGNVAVILLAAAVARPPRNTRRSAADRGVAHADAIDLGAGLLQEDLVMTPKKLRHRKWWS